MTERDFFYWLQGYLELSDGQTLNEKQIKIIKDHIKLVAIKVTPNNTLTTIGHGITYTPTHTPVDTAIIC